LKQEIIKQETALCKPQVAGKRNHEVHDEDCRYLAEEQNTVYLGIFSTAGMQNQKQKNAMSK